MSKITETVKAEKRGNYPYYALPKCLEVSELIRDLGGHKIQIPRSVIAEKMKINGNSPSLSQIIAAAKCFGLIHGWGTVTLTGLAARYFFPTDETERRKAILDVVKMPAVFEKLITRFDGSRLPANAMIANLVNREMGVPDSWKARTASLFVSALHEIKVIDNAGFLRYDAAIHAAESGSSGNLPKIENKHPDEGSPPPAPPPPVNPPEDDLSPSPSRMAESVALALLAKFPDFDPTWGAEQQTAWFSAYEKLLAMNDKKLVTS